MLWKCLRELLARFGENRIEELISLQNELYKTIDILKSDKQVFRRNFCRWQADTPEEPDKTGSDAEEE